MKTKILALLISAMFGSTAYAQSMWDGPYVGGSIANLSGKNTYDGFMGEASFDLEGQMFGAFAGYNKSTKRLILGGEVFFMTGAAYEEGFEDQYEYSSFVDFKGRLGVSIERLLPYAVVGASFGTFDVNDPTIEGRDTDRTKIGLVFGLGAEYAINDQLSIGAEYNRRHFALDFPVETNLADIKGAVNSLALRGSYRF